MSDGFTIASFNVNTNKWMAKYVFQAQLTWGMVFCWEYG